MTTLLPLERLSLLQGFGRSSRSAAFLYRPTDASEIAELFRTAPAAGYSIALRGSGRSYGDAALNGGNVVLDLSRMRRVLDWNPETGLLRAEPGMTIQQVFNHTLEDGWWPPVVPGTFMPTLGGVLGMNIHGKNNYHVGPIGEHVRAFTALLPTGVEVTCSPTENADLFYAFIGGLGLLGVFTSVTLQMKRVYSGNIDVHAWATPNLAATLAAIDEFKESDYVVGWVDTTVGGRALGRGQIHRGRYLDPGEDPAPFQTLRREYQTLSDSIALFPKSILWQCMRPIMNNFGMYFVNTGKYLFARTYSHHRSYRQSLTAFNFLLDYIPRWEESYGARGLIQHQSFIPCATAPDAYREIITLAQKRGLPAFLGVLKRHRPDKFLLSHAVDGYSIALDFKVPRSPARLQALTDELNRIVLAASGRFYFAKDSTLTPPVVAQFLGAAAINQFSALKQRCDPDSILQTEMYRRLFTPAYAESHSTA